MRLTYDLMLPEMRVDAAVSSEFGDRVRPSRWIWLRTEYVPRDPVARPEPDGDMLRCPFHGVYAATSSIEDGAVRLGVVVPDAAAFVEKAVAVRTPCTAQSRSTTQ